jgi:hypothetical protein
MPPEQGLEAPPQLEIRPTGRIQIGGSHVRRIELDRGQKKGFFVMSGMHVFDPLGAVLNTMRNPPAKRSTDGEVFRKKSV